MGAVLGIDKILSPNFRVSSNYVSTAFLEYKNVSSSLFFPSWGTWKNVLMVSQLSKLFLLKHEKAFTQIVCSEQSPLYFAEFQMDFRTPYCQISNDVFSYYWRKGVSCHLLQAVHVSGSGGSELFFYKPYLFINFEICVYSRKGLRRMGEHSKKLRSNKEKKWIF